MLRHYLINWRSANAGFGRLVTLIVIVAVVGLGFGIWYGFPEPEKHSLFVTAVAALLTAFATFVLAVVTYGQLKHNQVVERAYVKASPAKVSLGTEERIFADQSLCLKITNHGTTPARITDVLMRAVIIPNDEALPEIPHYKRSSPNDSTGFLVSNDWYFR